MELLRIALSAKQIREACIEWAFARTSVEDCRPTVEGLADGTEYVVVFTKKRTRKVKGAT